MAFDMPSAGLQSDRYGLGRIRLHPFQGGKKIACCFNFWVLTALLTAYPKIYIYISRWNAKLSNAFCGKSK